MSRNVSPNTKIKVFELYKNGESLFEQFFDEVEQAGNLMSNLAASIRIIEDTANLNRRPKSKFRPIEGHKLNCKIYEAKSGIIRVYLFHEERTGRIIVTGGMKGDQDKDIKGVLKLIKEYFDENQ